MDFSNFSFTYFRVSRASDALFTPPIPALGEKEGVTINVVNYSAMAHDPLFKQFGAYLAAANATLFTKEEHYAFYMNAYNYLAVRTVR
jgi:hypothetical protein